MPKDEICPGCRKVNRGHGKFCSSCRSRASRRGIKGAGTDDFEIVVEEPAPAKEVGLDQFAALVKATRKGAVPFEDLCNALDLSPARLRDLLDRAREANLVIGVREEKVGFLNTPRDGVQETGISPVVGHRQQIGYITDTHLGSKWCLRHYLKDFVEYAYSKGVREILHTGDVLDGNYRGHGFERSHEGLTEQIRDLFEVLPAKPGLTYHAISGNHDQTFEDESGVDVGAAISGYFRDRGRSDWRAYGTRGAMLRVRGVLIDMWHPSGGVSYAVSYKMQKKIESYAPGHKPQILLIGHWHRYCSIEERGVYALAGGTFQGGGSAFAKSLTCGPPAIGGTLLSWDLTEQGTIRDFVIERRSYFEREVAQELRA
jgi:predicted phosphodiesterase